MPWWQVVLMFVVAGAIWVAGYTLECRGIERRAKTGGQP